MTTYTINGQRIYAREEGSPTGQVALLIHGWSSSWYATAPLLPVLGRRFACIAVDLPGYGNSPAPDKRITINDYADILAALIQEVSDRPVVLVGHSMGGMISVTIALRHPQLVERMVLIAPTISGRLSTFINLFVSPITWLESSPLTNGISAALAPSVVNITDRIMRPALFAQRSGISEDDYKRLRSDARRPGQGRVRAQCYRAMRENDLQGRLKDVETPALVIWGAEDNTVPLRDAGVVADEWPSADLRILPKAGHWPHFEVYDATIRIIASYLGLPVVTTRLDDSVSTAALVDEAALFLAHSDVGNGLTLPQRTRLAGQLRSGIYAPGKLIVGADEQGSDLFIVQKGSVEVLGRTGLPGQTIGPLKQLATMQPGQIAGELSLIDGGQRSAELRAGPDGATLLTLKRDRLVALCEDDPTIGTRVLWNIAAALALRLRLTNWRAQAPHATVTKE